MAASAQPAAEPRVPDPDGAGPPPGAAFPFAARPTRRVRVRVMLDGQLRRAETRIA